MSIQKRLSSRKLKLSDDEKSKILELICDDLDNSMEGNSDIKKQMDRIDCFYNNTLPKKTTPWENCSSINVPVIATKVHLFLARAMRTIFGGGKIWTSIPGNDRQVKDSPIIELVVDYIARAEIMIKTGIRRLLTKVGKYGTAIGHPYWHVKKEMVHEIASYDNIDKFLKDFPSAEESGVDVKTYNGYIKDLENGDEIVVDIEYEEERGFVKFDVIDRRDFVVHKDVKDYNDAKITAQQLWQNWYEIQAKVNTGEYGEDNNGQDLDLLKKQINISTTMSEKEKEEVYHKPLRSFKCLWKYDLEGNGEREDTFIVSVVYNDSVKHLLRIEYYNYIHSRCFFIPFKIQEGDGPDGIGFGDMLLDLNIYTNARHDQRVDAGTLANMRVYKTRRGSELEESSLKFSHGTLLILDENEDLDLIPNPPVNNSDLILEEQMLERLEDQRVSISGLSTGRESVMDPRAPAAKTAMLIQQQDIGIGDYLDCLGPYFGDLAYQIIALYHQFGFTDEAFTKKVPQLTGDGWKMAPYTREELNFKGMQFDLRASHEGTNDLVNRVKFREIFDILMPVIQGIKMGQISDEQVNLVKLLLERYKEVIGSDILPSKKEMEKKQIEIMKKALEQKVAEGLQGIQDETTAKTTAMLQQLAAVMDQMTGGVQQQQPMPMPEGGMSGENPVLPNE